MTCESKNQVPPSEPTDEKTSIFIKKREAIAELGKQLPFDFINDLSDKALETVYYQLQKGQVSEQIAELLNCGHALKDHCVSIVKGLKMDAITSSDVMDSVVDIIKLLYAIDEPLI